MPLAEGSGFIRTWLSAGYHAVTFFFVLSGFVLFYAYAKRGSGDRNSLDVRQFAVHRFARIGPSYYLGLLILLPPFLYSTFITGTISLPEFGMGLVLVPMLLQSWFPPAVALWCLPAWSLSVEISFYLAFPRLLQFTSNLPTNRLLILAAAILLLTTLPRLGFELLAHERDSSAWINFVTYFPLFHVGGFIFGMALSKIYLFGRCFCATFPTVTFHAALVASCLLLSLKPMLQWVAIVDFLLIPAFGLILLSACAARGPIAALLSSRGAVLLGNASYAMYILHLGILFWWNRAARDWHPDLATNSLAGGLLAIGAIVAISIAVHLFIETPIRILIIRRLHTIHRGQRLFPMS